MLGRAAIQAAMTVFDLEEMELAYSPQYGSAKDPINMAGFVAGGLLRGDHPQIDVEAVLDNAPGKPPFLVDVRTLQELTTGTSPGAVNIPLDEPRARRSRASRRLGESQPIARLASGATWQPASCSRRVSGLRNIGGGYKTYRLFRQDLDQVKLFAVPAFARASADPSRAERRLSSRPPGHPETPLNRADGPTSVASARCTSRR